MLSEPLRQRVSMLVAVVTSVVFLLYSLNFFVQARDYEPIAQRTLLDLYNRPVGEQDLLTMAMHNPGYPIPSSGYSARGGRMISEEGAEPARYFAQHLLLDIFNYGKADLESGAVLKKFLSWCSEQEAVDIHNNSFRDLGQQRIVIKQDAFVRPEIIGNLEYVGSTTNRPYESMSNYTVDDTVTMLFKGRMLLTVHASKNFPTFYDVEVQVQRAVLQDKIKGYQCTELTLR